MKKTYLFAGVASILLACNSNSNSKSTNHDTLNHKAHQADNPNSKSQDLMNPITETMDKMMQEMHVVKLTGNNEVDFAAMMLEHHKGAVEMSKVEIDKGANAELKAFAQKVIDDQNREIGSMQDFISRAPRTISSNSSEFQKALNQSMIAMMGGNKVYNDIDRDFASQMIPHHQSAVDMAKAYLQYGKEASLTALSQNIINSQEKEINWLKEWLASNEK